MKKLTTGVAIAAVFAVGLSIAFAKGVFTGSATSAEASESGSPGGRPASGLADDDAGNPSGGVSRDGESRS